MSNINRGEVMRRRIVALILSITMAVSVTACSSSDKNNNEAGQVSDVEVSEGDTIGTRLAADFNQIAKDSSLSAQDIAEELLKNEAIEFNGAVVQVEEGLLTGFGNAEIKGFNEGAMFSPVIGSIAFVGYVFTLDENADTKAFGELLTQNSDPRWNVCVEADETVTSTVGNKVMFVMCPEKFED